MVNDWEWQRVVSPGMAQPHSRVRQASSAVTSVGAANENSQEYDCNDHAATDVGRPTALSSERGAVPAEIFESPLRLGTDP